MALNDMYQRQVSLLLRVLPYAAEESCFALKGGTAINLFIRDMPRLSVDIDLTYLPIFPRAQSLAEIDTALRRISTRIAKGIPRAQVKSSPTTANKLLIRSQNVQIKIEVTPVLRGCVYEPQLRAVSASVEAAYGFAEIQVVSFADLYAGKIVAALDRQHPRDLFDVRDLLRNEGIDADLRRAFIVYLLSHDRPMHEILAPVRKPLLGEFKSGFEGMTGSAVSLEELELAREQLIESIVGSMPEPHRQFLKSFELGTPDWPLLGVTGAMHLPAVTWRQRNLDTLAAEVRAKLTEKLRTTLYSAKTRTA